MTEPQRGFFAGNAPLFYPDQADIMKERLLLTGINTAPDLDPENDPNTLVPPLGGPYFIMSPEAPSGIPTTGFCMTVLSVGGGVTPGVGGFTLTAWRLILAFGVQAVVAPRYTAFQPVTGANFNQEFVSFDCDAGLFRFQIENFVLAAGPTDTIMFAFCEL